MVALALSDALLLRLSLAAVALNGIEEATRTDHAAVACGMVESAVRQQWRDITSWEPVGVCHGMAAWLASYSLIGQRGYQPGQGANASIVERYNKAAEWLDLVAKGVREPGVTGTRIVRAHVSSEARRRGDCDDYYGLCGCRDGFRVRRY